MASCAPAISATRKTMAASSFPPAQAVGVAPPAGTRPVAFVIVRPGATLDEAAAIAHCRARIAKYKVPARIVCLDAFPVTQSANGTKIQRAKLRAMAEEAMRRQAG